MTKVGTAIQLDADVLERLDAAAARLGRSRDELIEDSVRRDLAGQLLTAVFADADAADTADVDVTALVYEEIDRARVERREPGRPAG